MTRKIISWLPLWAVFLFTLSSCVHDEVYSASDPESGEYTNKSLWKEDEVYIKNVQQIFSANANLENFRSRHHGLPVWDYAMTFGSFDESYLMVPISGKNGIKEVMIVERKNDKVFFSTSDDTDASHFFRNLIFKNNGVAGIKSQIEENARMMCKTRTYTLCFGNPNGSQSCYPNEVTTCVQQNELGDNEMGNGGGGIDYPSGGGGGNNSNEPPQTPPNPCEKLKEQTTNITFKNNVTTLEGKTGDSYESGFRISNTGQNQLLQNKPGTQQVDLKAFSNTVTLMHSHYDGLYPIFSPGDIIFFNQWVVWAQNWNSVSTNNPKIPLNNLTFTLVTSSGNYSFNFDGTSTTALPNYTQQDIDDLNDKYMRLLDEAKTVANVSGSVTFNMDKLEKQFLKFIDDKMNMTGLKLYKTTTNGNAQLNLVNGNRNEVPCPN